MNRKSRSQIDTGAADAPPGHGQRGLYQKPCGESIDASTGSVYSQGTNRAMARRGSALPSHAPGTAARLWTERALLGMRCACRPVPVGLVGLRLRSNHVCTATSSRRCCSLRLWPPHAASARVIRRSDGVSRTRHPWCLDETDQLAAQLRRAAAQDGRRPGTASKTAASSYRLGRPSDPPYIAAITPYSIARSRTIHEDSDHPRRPCDPHGPEQLLNKGMIPIVGRPAGRVHRHQPGTPGV